MPTNSNSTEVTFTYPSMRDGDPQEVALEGVRDYEKMLTYVIGFAEDLERIVTNGAMQDSLDTPAVRARPDQPPYEYAQGTLELAQLVRAAGALGVAHRVAREARETLETPLLERRGVGDA